MLWAIFSKTGIPINHNNFKLTKCYLYRNIVKVNICLKELSTSQSSISDEKSSTRLWDKGHLKTVLWTKSLSRVTLS